MPRRQSIVFPLDERVRLYTRIASVLVDPDPDGRTKFDLDFFPYTGLNVRRYQDDEFLFDYRV